MEKNFWDSVPSRLKQQWGDHGYPECDCDMCGGDEFYHHLKQVKNI